MPPACSYHNSVIETQNFELMQMCLIYKSCQNSNANIRNSKLMKIRNSLSLLAVFLVFQNCLCQYDSSEQPITTQETTTSLITPDSHKQNENGLPTNNKLNGDAQNEYLPTNDQVADAGQSDSYHAIYAGQGLTDQNWDYYSEWEGFQQFDYYYLGNSDSNQIVNEQNQEQDASKGSDAKNSGTNIALPIQILNPSQDPKIATEPPAVNPEQPPIQPGTSEQDTNYKDPPKVISTLPPVSDAVPLPIIPTPTDLPVINKLPNQDPLAPSPASPGQSASQSSQSSSSSSSGQTTAVRDPNAVIFSFSPSQQNTEQTTSNNDGLLPPSDPNAVMFSFVPTQPQTIKTTPTNYQVMPPAASDPNALVLSFVPTHTNSPLTVSSDSSSSQPAQDSTVSQTALSFIPSKSGKQSAPSLLSFLPSGQTQVPEPSQPPSQIASASPPASTNPTASILSPLLPNSATQSPTPSS